MITAKEAKKNADEVVSSMPVPKNLVSLEYAEFRIKSSASVGRYREDFCTPLATYTKKRLKELGFKVQKTDYCCTTVSWD